MAREIGRKVHDSADGSWNWHGREVFIADGTGLLMADTPENQLAYPQSGKSPKTIGFPITPCRLKSPSDWFGRMADRRA
jgi:hypothetical protein